MYRDNADEIIHAVFQNILGNEQIEIPYPRKTIGNMSSHFFVLDVVYMSC